jgi:hypothetical protein
MTTGQETIYSTKSSVQSFHRSRFQTRSGPVRFVCAFEPWLNPISQLRKHSVPPEMTDLHAYNVSSLVDLANISALTFGMQHMICRGKSALRRSSVSRARKDFQDLSCCSTSHKIFVFPSNVPEEVYVSCKDELYGW